MESTIGKNLKITVWGGSHEPAIGVDIRGLPKGTRINMTELEAFLKRRAPGSSFFATKRKEPDIPLPVKGLAPVKPSAKKGSGDNPAPTAKGQTPVTAPEKTSAPAPTGPTTSPAAATAAGNQTSAPAPAETEIQASAVSLSPAYSTTSPADRQSETIMITTEDTISLEIKNTDTRSSDYKTLRTVPRPGHADYTARLRYGDKLNMAGGGPFSARMTAPLCIAGGIAIQILEQKDIHIGAHIAAVADAKDIPFDPVNIRPELLNSLKQKDMAVISDTAKTEMQKAIWLAMEDLDSVGGTVEVCAVNLPAGLGGAMYDGLESVLSPIFFGIPAVKGVEFGAGFAAAAMTGSQNNDAFCYDGDTIKTKTNNHGGILGGITTGMPLIARLAFKPTPSIAKEQDSVDLDKRENTKLKIKGRHDPCVVVRAVPIAEAAMALGILDCMMEVQQ